MPVCPTCSPWVLQPASTTALEAPTAAPSESANSSIRLKCSAPFIPLPPETIISASATSSLPSDFLNSTTRVFRLGEETSFTVTSTEEPSVDCALKTFGRIVITFLPELNFTSTNALPA